MLFLSSGGLVYIATQNMDSRHAWYSSYGTPDNPFTWICFWMWVRLPVGGKFRAPAPYQCRLLRLCGCSGAAHRTQITFAPKGADEVPRSSRVLRAARAWRSAGKRTAPPALRDSALEHVVGGGAELEYFGPVLAHHEAGVERPPTKTFLFSVH